jgi:hypothetical protein
MKHCVEPLTNEIVPIAAAPALWASRRCFRGTKEDFMKLVQFSRPDGNKVAINPHAVVFIQENDEDADTTFVYFRHDDRLTIQGRFDRTLNELIPGF